MAAFIDYTLVGLALLASLVYAFLALGPRSWRRRIRGAFGLQSSAEKSSGSCGGCEGCASDTAASATAAPPAAAEINIPVAKIGRR